MKKWIIFTIVIIVLWDVNVLEGNANEEPSANTNNRDARKAQFKRNLEDLLKVVWKCSTTTSKPVAQTCRSDSMPCNNGVCIPLRWRCDGKSDCLTGEDEQYCPAKCHSHEFRCVSGKCIELTRRCDGKYDCSDADDEMNCGTKKCNQSSPCAEVSLYGKIINQTVHEIQTNIDEAREDILDLKSTPNGPGGIPNTCANISGLQDQYISLKKITEHTFHFIEDLANKLKNTSQDKGGDNQNITTTLEQMMELLQLQGGNKCNGSTSCSDLMKYEIDINKTVNEIKSQINENQPACDVNPGNSTSVPCDALNDIKSAIGALNASIEGVYVAITELSVSIDNKLELWLKKVENMLNKTVTGLEENIPKLQGNTTEKYPSPGVAACTTEQTIATEGTTVISPVTKDPQTFTVDELTIITTKLNDSVQQNLPPKDFNDTVCPKDYEQMGSSCYYFSERGASFAGASKWCRDHGSFMLLIDNEEEDNYLKAKLMGMKPPAIYFTGANDILKEDRFVSEANGKPLNFTNWFDDGIFDPEPNSLFEMNCAKIQYPYMKKGYVWQDIECGRDPLSANPPLFICEKTLTGNSFDSDTVPKTTEELTLDLKDLKTTIDLITPRRPGNASTSCPIGFIKAKTGCYVINRSLIPWYEAQYMCEDIGGWLAHITSVEEQDILEALVADKLNYFQTSSCSQNWIGGYSITEEKGLTPLTPDYPTTAPVYNCLFHAKPHGTKLCSIPSCSICEAEILI